MWLTILDYQNGEVIVEEVLDEPQNGWEDYVREKIGHSSECHMVQDYLNLKINE